MARTNCRIGDQMKEIGGYFQLDQFIDKPYHKNMIELNTGRNALIYLIKAKKIKKLYLPYFLCNSVSNKLDKYLIEYEYYRITKDFLPEFNKELKGNEFLYIVNYYGQIANNKLSVLKEKYKNIIVDNTQAFFQSPIIGIDTIYSCRKFFGVPDGAYLSTDTILDEELEIDSSSDRMSHILGRFEGKASDYYEDFRNNDNSFSELPLRVMSKLTRNILGAINYERIKKIRESNFSYLHERLKANNILNIREPEGAFTYPYYVKNGIDIRKKLIDKRIYIPTLWPNVLQNNSADTIEYDYAANILPLPCDQRYTQKDMDLIVKELKNV